MSLDMGRFDIGRIFFNTQDDDPFGIPQQVRVIPLRCHVENVHRFAEHWASLPQAQAFGDAGVCLWDSTRDSVLSSALRHDVAKPECLRITYKDGVFGYSYAGHRYRVRLKELYEDALIRGHHNFSVQEITEAAYDLCGALANLIPEELELSAEALENRRKLLALSKRPDEFLRRYTSDLYILQMCDQIEASLETHVLSYEKAESRNFMDFSVYSTEDMKALELFKSSGKMRSLSNVYAEAHQQHWFLLGEAPTFQKTLKKSRLDQRSLAIDVENGNEEHSSSRQRQVECEKVSGLEETFWLEPCPWEQKVHGDVLEMYYDYQEMDVPEEIQEELRNILTLRLENVQRGVGKRKARLEKEAKKRAARKSKKKTCEESERFDDSRGMEDSLPSAKQRDFLAEKACQLLLKWLKSACNQEALQTKKIQLHAFPQEETTPQPEHMEEILGFPALNPMQENVRGQIIQGAEEGDGTALLLRAPTGSGKTEAIVWPCLEQGRRLILALPTRSLLDDHAQRVERILEQAARTTRRVYTLILDTGVRTTQSRFTPHKGKVPGKRRHLYQGDIILTTLDKLVYRYFGFSDKTKSMVFPHRIAQSNTLLCFDEAHSYEGLAWSNFRMLVEALYKTGQDLVLMTATMPKVLLETFEDLDMLDFSEGEYGSQLKAFFRELRGGDASFFPQKKLTWKGVAFDGTGFESEFDESEAYEEALTHALAQETKAAVEGGSQRLIVVCHTVKSAVALFEQLQEDSSVQQSKIPILLYHGRLASYRRAMTVSSHKQGRIENPRADVYQTLKQKDEEKQPYLLVTTHAIEVGCDLDADCLVTAFCNPDSLIQRAGRCNRRCQNPHASLVVVGERIPSYLRVLPEKEEQSFLKALQGASGALFEATDFAKFLVPEERSEDPRLLELFEMLYSYIYEGNILYKALYQRGLLVTRSWQPSVTVRVRWGAWVDEVAVPIERLRLRKEDEGLEEVSTRFTLKEKRYLPSESRYHEVPLLSGDAYRKREIILEIGEEDCVADGSFEESEFYDAKRGLYNLPRLFEIFSSRDSMKRITRFLAEGQKRTLLYYGPYDGS